jgi:hypothetical protein
MMFGSLLSTLYGFFGDVLRFIENCPSDKRMNSHYTPSRNRGKDCSFAVTSMTRQAFVSWDRDRAQLCGANFVIMHIHMWHWLFGNESVERLPINASIIVLFR